MGEVLGGILFGFMGHWTVKRGRDPIVMLGFVLSMIAYFFMFLNIPANAPLGEADPWEYGYIRPNKHLALFTSFLLGFSDACFMTQVSSIMLCIFYREYFRFNQSLVELSVTKLPLHLAFTSLSNHSPLVLASLTHLSLSSIGSC